MHRYETLFILHPDLPEAQVRETNDRASRLIESMNGQVAEMQDWGLRELAYPIRKQSRGTYILAQYTATPDVVKELERTFKLADEVLRFISVRMPQGRKSGRSGRRSQPSEVKASTEGDVAEQGN